MESLICVSDAQTFVDHIHAIKAWLYGGQLRLIVPSSLPENVEQLYQKSLEPKLTAKETPKPKVLGKPAKKEYPAFDANPKIAKAFLARIQAGKEYETGDFGRPIYEEEERHGSVHFVPSKEQYSPWKDVEDYEEKVELPADRAESWAEKLRRKQNVVNGNAEDKPAKGPVKPKLVARMGVDNSPWKVQKNAPTIPVTEVPNPLRPMMSCALWRIHESIHRNDENQVFVLTEQSSVRDVAKKLNINCRSTKELARNIDSQNAPVDLAQVGEIEQQLGVKEVEERRPDPRKSVQDPKRQVAESSAQQEEESFEDVIPTEVPPKKEISVTDEKSRSSQDYAEKLDGVGEAASQLDSTVLATNGDSSTRTTEGAPGGLAASESHPQHLASKESRGTLSNPPETTQGRADGLEESCSNLLRSSELGQAQAIETAVAFLETPARPANVTLRSFAEALTGNQPRKAAPPQTSDSAVINERSVTPARIPSPNPEPKSQPTPMMPADAPQEPEDSDEEVVVFQPKRLSAQTKPTQQSSRPSTPNIQVQRAPTTDTPWSAPSKPQSTPKTRHHTPRHKPTNVSNHTDPAAEDGPAPVVIDPDAFGRSFAVNTNKDSRGSVRGTRARHSPQASLFNAGPNPPRPSSSHRQPRSSPNRPSPKTSPPQAPRLPVQMERVASGTQLRAMPPRAPMQPAAPVGAINHKQAPPKHPAHMPKAPNAAPSRHTPPARRPPMQSNGPSPVSQHKPMPIGTGRPIPTVATDIRVQTLNANAPVFQPAGMANPPPRQSPLQQRQATPELPVKQPPIGSGRPKSKDSQAKPAVSADLSPSVPSAIPPQNLDLLSDLKLPTSTSSAPTPQPESDNLLRDLKSELPSLANVSRPVARGKPSFAPSAGVNGRAFVSRSSPNGNFRPSSQNVQGTRPVKQSLFDPELDHTRAYQPEPTGSRKSNVPDVHYVVKSGATREQARGKGKLWIG